MDIKSYEDKRLQETLASTYVLCMCLISSFAIYSICICVCCACVKTISENWLYQLQDTVK